MGMVAVTMTIDEASERLVTARIRWSQARTAWLDDDGSDIPGEAANRWEWAQAQRALAAAEAELAEAIAASADEG
jgi:hypothetical protein